MDKLKSTFKQTKFNESKKKETAIGIDGKEVELNEEEEDDEDYVPEQAPKVWDDEENSVQEEADASNKASEEGEQEENEADEDAPISMEELLSADHQAHDEIIASQVSKMVKSVQSYAAKSQKSVHAEKKKELAAFFEDEAELGSDDEEKGDMAKSINKDDAEENEDGLDKDLEGFIDRQF